MSPEEKLATRREKMRLYMAKRRQDPVFAQQNRDRVKQWQSANREKSRELSRAWRAANPEKVKEANLRWRAEQGPEALSARGRDTYRRCRRASHLKSKFGITVEQYEAMLLAQDGHCALCPEVDQPEQRLAVDHDHNTGKIRGLLCDRCNRGIGFLDEDPERLRGAATYIEHHKLTLDPLLA